jgi:4-carboxymuconolactone decarboxylase
MTTDGRYARGNEIRTAVLGAEYVKAATERATDFNRPLQELITEYCWGTVWARPGLDRRTRSLINIAMLSALNQQAELTLHVGGALRNGCTVEEVQEVLLQVAVYCGVPAALNGFRSAQAAMEKIVSADQLATEGTAVADASAD